MTLGIKKWSDDMKVMSDEIAKLMIEDSNEPSAKSGGKLKVDICNNG